MQELPEGLTDLGIERMEIVHLQPGDVIVLTSPSRLDDETYAQVTEAVQSCFGDHRVGILEGGMTMKVFREGGAP